MIEIFTALGMSELGAYIISLGSPILALVALVVVAAMSIYKVSKAVQDLKGSSEIQKLVEELHQERIVNETSQRLNKRLLREICRIKGVEEDDELSN